MGTVQEKNNCRLFQILIRIPALGIELGIYIMHFRDGIQIWWTTNNGAKMVGI